MTLHDVLKVRGSGENSSSSRHPVCHLYGTFGQRSLIRFRRKDVVPLYEIQGPGVLFEKRVAQQTVNANAAEVPIADLSGKDQQLRLAQGYERQRQV